MAKFKIGTDVSWEWGGHRAHGKIVEGYTHDVTRTLKGATVCRQASKNLPAYLVRQEDGDEVLKSQSELEPHHG